MRNVVIFILVFFSIICQKKTYKYDEGKNPYVLFENLQESFLDKNGDGKFPFYYGGAYIKDSSLVIIVIGDDTLRDKKDLIERCKGSNFLISHCEERKDAVRRMLHYLYLFRTDEKNKKIVDELGFISSCMNSDERIDIQLLSFREKEFRKLILDSPFLDFAESIVVFE